MLTTIVRRKPNSVPSIFSLRWLSLAAAVWGALSLALFISVTAQAAETKAVTVSSSNNSLGAVFCTHNGTSFEHYTYAEPADYISVTALPVNKNYHFLHWTDNGVIVSNDSTYSFAIKDQNHMLVAHFDAKPEMKHKRYDPDKNISSITRNTNACVFAPGYKIDGMTINTALIPVDETTENAVETMTGGNFTGAFRIQFTFGYDGKEKQTLDQPTRIILKLPVAQAGTCRIVSLAGAAPVVLDDLDTEEQTVTFEISDSGLYIVTCTNTSTATPLQPTAPLPPVIPPQPAVPLQPTIPAQPAASPLPPVSSSQPAAPATPVVPAPSVTTSVKSYSPYNIRTLQSCVR